MRRDPECRRRRGSDRCVGEHAVGVRRPARDRDGARHRRAGGGGAGARRRRWLRCQGRCVRRAAGRGGAGAATGSRGRMGRDPPREPGQHDARARSGTRRRDRRAPGRHGGRLAGGRRRGCRRVSDPRCVRPDGDALHGIGDVPHPRDRVPRVDRAHQHDADRTVPRGGPARSGRVARTFARPPRRRARPRSGHDPAPQLHPARRVPVHDADRSGLRHRRLRAPARHRALRESDYDSLARGAIGAANPWRCSPARHRHRLLRRGERARRRVRIGAHRAGRHRDGCDRQRAERPGSRDGMGPDRLGGVGRAVRGRAGRALRHRDRPARRGHVRLAVVAARRQRGP